MFTTEIPEGFLRDDETVGDLYDPDDPTVLEVDFGVVEGFRVVYARLARNWCADSPDLGGVVTTGSDRADVERNMREAIPFHLEGMAEDRKERPWLYEGEVLNPQVRDALKRFAHA